MILAPVIVHYIKFEMSAFESHREPVRGG